MRTTGSAVTLRLVGTQGAYENALEDAQHGRIRHLQRRTAQHGTAQQSTAQHCTAWDSTAQHSTAQRGTAQHSVAQHSTAQHSTAQHTPDGGLIIHGCHWQQEVGDVSNVHSQLEIAAGKVTHMQGVINVFAAGRVDATDRQMPQVFPAVSAWRQSVRGGSKCVEAVSAWRYQNTQTRERTLQS